MIVRQYPSCQRSIPSAKTASSSSFARCTSITFRLFTLLPQLLRPLASSEAHSEQKSPPTSSGRFTSIPSVARAATSPPRSCPAACPSAPWTAAAAGGEKSLQQQPAALMPRSQPHSYRVLLLDVPQLADVVLIQPLLRLLAGAAHLMAKQISWFLPPVSLDRMNYLLAPACSPANPAAPVFSLTIFNSYRRPFQLLQSCRY